MKLINGNCLTEMDKLIEQGIKVDAIITDPPYGVNFKNDFYNDDTEFVNNESIKWLNKMFALLKEGSHIYIYVPTKNIEMWINNFKKVGFEFKNILTTKCKSNNYNTNNNFKYDTQFILYGSKGKAKNFNKVDFQKTSEVWLKDKRNKNPKPYTYVYSSIFDMYSTELTKLEHPNQKSVDFINILIKLSTNEGDTVLDPFMGSGTTGVACKNLNRHFIGIEFDKKYFNISYDRLMNKI